MNTPLKRIRLGAIVLLLVLLVAIVGYRITGRSWVDSLYMVVITISTVCFTEKTTLGTGEMLFTIVVIVFGISAVAYTFGGLIQMTVEGEIQRTLGHRRMTQGIDRLSGHIIVCGYGRIGQILAQDLTRQKKPFVIIDTNDERISEAMEQEMLVIQGDATEESVLLSAGVERAKTLVTGLPNDVANVFITLTSRNLNEDLQIIARAEQHTTQKKLYQAGANRVVMPASIGARQMARIITRPTTADLMELLADHSILEVELDEITITEASKLVDTNVIDAEAHRRHGLLVVAIKQAQGEMVFSPSGQYACQAGDTIIVMGRAGDIDRFKKEYQLKS